LEAPYHALCNAGHISYIEFDDNPSPENVEKITRHAFSTSNIGYIGFNFHIRYCLDCARNIHKNIINEHFIIMKGGKNEKTQQK
jgi:ribonucleoside-triphosphate reductase